MKQKPGWTTVFNLGTGEYEGTWSTLPDIAVLCAYAQSINDWNSWSYEERYGHLVRRSREIVACGDFSAVRRGDTRLLRQRGRKRSWPDRAATRAGRCTQENPCPSQPSTTAG
jgi:hypothetical protein